MDDLKPLAHSLRPLTGSSSSLAKTSHGHAERQNFSTERARLLLGQFRRGEANDPGTFVASVAAVLSRYSTEIVMHVTDPRTGLAVKGDWLPTVREVATECDRLAAEDRRRQNRAAQIEAQLLERQRHERAAPRPTLEELRTKHGPNWGLDFDRRVEQRAQRSLAELALAAGVTQAQIDAMPNLPPRRDATE